MIHSDWTNCGRENNDNVQALSNKIATILICDFKFRFIRRKIALDCHIKISETKVLAPVPQQSIGKEGIHSVVTGGDGLQ